jgi:DNA/RNA endonuclease YhcR with UshA esterase domain
VDTKNRFTIKAVVMFCVLILGIGATYFLLHTSSMTANSVSITSIDDWLNYASVWIEGTVISGPQMDNRSIAFEVQDSSGGTIEVTVYISPQTLKSQGMIPMVGDNVKVFGMLRVYLDGSVESRVSELDVDQFTGENKFQIIPTEAVETTILDVINTWHGSQSLRYKRVVLDGIITNVRALSSAKVYNLQDNENTIVQLYVHNGLSYVENGELDLKLLQTVRVTAGASQYGSSPQLALSSYEDVQVLENGQITSVAIENVDNTFRGQFIRTSGKIVFVELTGESDSLAVQKWYFWLENKDCPEVWMWNSVYKLLSDETRALLARGSTAELAGQVSSTGDLRIELVGPPELSLTAGTYEPTFVENVAEITSDNLGEFVTVQGTLTQIENVGAAVLLPYNRKLTLQDNLGELIEIMVSNTVYERLSEVPVVNENIRVVGKVISDSEEIQIQLGIEDDLVRVN